MQVHEWGQQLGPQAMPPVTNITHLYPLAQEANGIQQCPQQVFERRRGQAGEGADLPVKPPGLGPKSRGPAWSLSWSPPHRDLCQPRLPLLSRGRAPAAGDPVGRPSSPVSELWRRSHRVGWRVPCWP